jgi:hypothetical protein
VRLLAAVFRVDLRVAAAELVLLVLVRFAFPRAFFVDERVLRLRGFSVLPVTASTMLVAALDTPSIVASMLVLAASVIVFRTDVPSPSFSCSNVTSLRCLYVSVTLSLGRGQSRVVRKLCSIWVGSLFQQCA